jgi:hypothetical protein
MPTVGFKPTIPVLERENTFRALDRAEGVIDIYTDCKHKFVKMLIRTEV